eukprot:3940651-Rhodomonas_salina.7
MSWNSPSPARVLPHIWYPLRACYAKPGTDEAYGATRRASEKHQRVCLHARRYLGSLGICYAASGIALCDVQY